MQLQVPLCSQPTSVIPGTAGIVQHAILNDRRHVLTKVRHDVLTFFATMMCLPWVDCSSILVSSRGFHVVGYGVQKFTIMDSTTSGAAFTG